jgi:DNA-binding LacI/PurR family transcriptional regulator
MTAPEPPAPPTLAEVARSAGVSIATASRVLNNSAPVSPDVHDRVCTAASQLSYVRRRASTARSRHPIGSVAAVIHADHARLFGEAFFPRLITAAAAQLAVYGLPLLVVSVTQSSLRSVGRYLHGGHVDGAMVVADHGPYSLADSLPTLGLPVVVVGRSRLPSPVSYVDVDNRAAARQVVEYLYASGRRQLAHVAGPPDTVAAADRLAGFVDGLRARGVSETPVAYGDWSYISGVHATDRLMTKWPHLDGIFAASDTMAAGSLFALRRSGRRTPDDVAVVGFDDLPVAVQVNPTLTTVRQPIEEFGTRAARTLVAMIESGQSGPGATILPTTLIHRQSA